MSAKERRELKAQVDEKLDEKLDKKLDQALQDTFPASDPVSFTEPGPARKAQRPPAKAQRRRK